MDTGESQTTPSARKESTKAPMRLVVVSMLSVLVWAVLILIYSLWWSSGFSLFQNIIVAIVSLIITGVVVGLFWVIWGPRENWQMK